MKLEKYIIPGLIAAYMVVLSLGFYVMYGIFLDWFLKI